MSKKRNLAKDRNQSLRRQTPQQRPTQPQQNPPSAPNKPSRVGISVTAQQYEQFEQYRGFIPPQLIAAYEQSELGRQYVQELIAQGQHRRQLEKIVIEGDNKRSNWGLISANGIAYVFLAAGVYLTMQGHGWVGGTTIISSIGTLVSVFLRSSSRREQERAERLKLMLGKQPNAANGDSKSETPEEERTPRLPGL